MKRKIRIITISILTAIIAGCVSTPETSYLRGKAVKTYSALAGCGTLELDEDCSQMSGATRKIMIDGTNLRVSSGNQGRIIFVMAMPQMKADEPNLLKGTLAIESLFEENGIGIADTRVMLLGPEIVGVHYTLNADGYTLLKELSHQ